jgi:Predicted membrane protein
MNRCAKIRFARAITSSSFLDKTMNTRYPILFTIATLAILGVSLILAHSKSVWVLEVFPILIGFPLLFFTYPKFRFTNLVYGLLIIHFMILALGSIYTYAEVPLGYWMQDWFGFSRNNYDKIGHFAQGFIPAMLARELLIRTSPLRPGKWLAFIVLCICLAISALYEIIEWWVAAVQGASAEEFLGTQGYIWDAQSDMLFALVGAACALLLLSRVQDKGISKASLAGSTMNVAK